MMVHDDSRCSEASGSCSPLCKPRTWNTSNCPGQKCLLSSTTIVGQSQPMYRAQARKHHTCSISM